MNRRHHRHPLAVLVLAALAVGCPSRSDSPDAAPANRPDGATADSHDSAPADATDTSPDASAAPGEPAFVPRLFFRDDTVVCAPIPELVFTGAPTTAEPGALIWAVEETAEVQAQIRALLDPREPPVGYGGPFTATADGGFTAYAGGQVEVAYRADGAFDYVRRQTPPEPNARPLARLDQSDGALASYAAAGVVRTWGGELEQSFSVPALPAAGSDSQPWRDQLRYSMPAVLPSAGRVIWHAGSNAIVSSCIVGGATEWIVEYDVPVRLPARATDLRALADGSVVASAGWDFVRVSPGGEILARRRERDLVLEGASTACGLAFHVGDFQTGGRAEWWSPEDLSTIASRDLSSFTEPGDLGLGEMHLLRDCAVAFRVSRTLFETRGGFIVSRDGAGDAELDDFPIGGAGFVPLDDGGLLGFDAGSASLTVWERSGAARWHATYLREEIADGQWRSYGVLMPNGVLIASVRTRYVAIAVGAGAGSLPSFFEGGNWARTNGVDP